MPLINLEVFALTKLLVLFTAILILLGCVMSDTNLDASLSCPNRDVWAAVRYESSFDLHDGCLVLVHIPKFSLPCDGINCPSIDTKVVGEAIVDGKGVGMHVVTIEKGYLNNPKNYRFSPPTKPKCFPDNLSIWTAKNDKNEKDVFTSVD